jgi:hypothetical protein
MTILLPRNGFHFSCTKQLSPIRQLAGPILSREAVDLTALHGKRSAAPDPGVNSTMPFLCGSCEGKSGVTRSLRRTENLCQSAVERW